MNQAAKDALRQAWLDGGRQTFNQLEDGNGAVCALQLLMMRGIETPGLSRPVAACPLCGATRQSFDEYEKGFPLDDEGDLLLHYNNDHKFGFEKIAELMPDDPLDAAPAEG